jgi:hypothetical protein
MCIVTRKGTDISVSRQEREITPMKYDISNLKVDRVTQFLLKRLIASAKIWRVLRLPCGDPQFEFPPTVVFGC